jgi:hypothetical protein
MARAVVAVASAGAVVGWPAGGENVLQASTSAVAAASGARRDNGRVRDIFGSLRIDRFGVSID